MLYFSIGNVKLIRGFIIWQVGEARSLDRDVVESELHFAGFAVISQPLLFLFSSCLSFTNYRSLAVNPSPVLFLMWLLFFQVFDCPIRPDSASILYELKGSSHDLVYFTIHR